MGFLISVFKFIISKRTASGVEMNSLVTVTTYHLKVHLFSLSKCLNCVQDIPSLSPTLTTAILDVCGFPQALQPN
jgi:hypothetical protein